MAEFKIKVDFSDITNAFDRLLSKEVLSIIAKDVIKQIKHNANRGVNVFDHPLLPYEPKYADWKMKKGLSWASVDMIKSGSLLRSITFSTRKTGFSIYLRNSKFNNNDIKMEKYFTGNYKNWDMFLWAGNLTTTLYESIEREFIKAFGV